MDKDMDTDTDKNKDTDTDMKLEYFATYPCGAIVPVWSAVGTTLKTIC
jgi:hypothetical protein